MDKHLTIVLLASVVVAVGFLLFFNRYWRDVCVIDWLPYETGCVEKHKTEQQPKKQFAPIPESTIVDTKLPLLPESPFVSYERRQPTYVYNPEPYVCEEINDYPRILVQKHGDNGEYCYREEHDPGAGIDRISFTLTTAANEQSTITTLVTIRTAISCEYHGEEKEPACKKAKEQWKLPRAFETMRSLLDFAPPPPQG